MCDVRHPRQKEALLLVQGAADKSAAGTRVGPRGEVREAAVLELNGRVCGWWRLILD